MEATLRKTMHVKKVFRWRAGRAATGLVIALTVLGGMAVARVLPESLRTSPEAFLQTLDTDLEDGFDPAPLQDGSVASEHASPTAIDVLTVVEMWRNGGFESGCEFGQAVAAAARGDEENGAEPFDLCEQGAANGSSGGRGAERSAAGKAKGQAAAEAGKAKGEAAAEAAKAKGAEASADAKGRGAPGGGASNGGGGGGSGPPPDPGPPPGAGPPGGTPGGP